MQVLKQSDLVVLMYLLDDLFDGETKEKNYNYYEARTLHDSSLSKSTHSVLVNNLGLHETAYRFFTGASAIDLGEEMRSSNAGIHSASMRGTTLAVQVRPDQVNVTAVDGQTSFVLVDENVTLNEKETVSKAIIA